MLVKKQVSSSIRSVKNRGIIGVVRVIDHIVWEKCAASMDVDSGSDLDASFKTIDDLPSVVPRTAATYVGKQSANGLKLIFILFRIPIIWLPYGHERWSKR